MATKTKAPAAKKAAPKKAAQPARQPYQQPARTPVAVETSNEPVNLVAPPPPYPPAPVLRRTAYAGANLVTFTTKCNTYESAYEETRVTIGDEEIAIIEPRDIDAFTRDLREVIERYRR